MAHLPEGVEVILCAGPEGATRDFDDFSTTEHLIALGRAEASEIVRRYGLGTIPYPAPPLPVPALHGDLTDGATTRSPAAEPAADHDRRPAQSDGPVSFDRPAAEPVTQPEPGT
jgi:hypothetical protein